jgi:hypothetical protein
MKNKIKKELKTIKIPFPFDKFFEYEKKVGVKEESDFGIKEIREIFLLSINDFKKGKISSDELSSISEKLFNLLVKNNLFKQDENLFFAIQASAEISFYTRHPESENLNRFLKEVLDFAKS